MLLNLESSSNLSLQHTQSSWKALLVTLEAYSDLSPKEGNGGNFVKITYYALHLWAQEDKLAAKECYIDSHIKMYLSQI